jgi:hypothetical protein
MKHFPLCLFLAVTPALVHAAGEVALKLDLPKPLFLGTPRPIQVPNLEPLTVKQPDLMVPAGTQLLSKDKPVTSSDMFPVIGDLAFLTDGDKSGQEGANVELGPGLQWAQIDLGQPAKLAAIAVWHYHSQARVYHDVIVQVSNDPEFRTGVRTLYNNDGDNSAHLGKGTDPAYIETNRGRVIDAKGETARYVRLYSSGNTSDELNHYCEVEVYGESAK